MNYKLPPPIDFNIGEDKALSNSYSIYKSQLMNRDNRIKLFNEFIFVDCNDWIDYKSEGFWHLASLSETERFNIFPCNNDITQEKCGGNCLTKSSQIILSNGEKRNICYYRAARINWITVIINLANKDDFRIKTWIKDGKLHIRFQENLIDYILIFLDKNINSKRFYYFITAFPVFYITSKKGYDMDYSNYINSTKK